jgi:amino acid permease
VFVYSTAITNDSASFLQSFGVTKTLLSENPFYGLALICGLVALASRGENLLFKISTFMVLTKLGAVAVLGLMMVDKWDFNNVGTIPATGDWLKDAVVMLPFTLTSILFIQSLSPMVISYRSREKSLAVARFKAMRAMNIAFGVLFVVVFFYAVSFTLAMGHDQAVRASEENISALAMVAQGMPGQTLKLLSLTLNIFAVMTAYFGVYLGFREACQGLTMNMLRRYMPESSINKNYVGYGIMLFTILLSWGAIVLNAPVLSFTSICSPIFGLVGCLIPAYLVYQVPALHKYKGVGLYIIIITGLLLCVSPFLAFS